MIYRVFLAPFPNPHSKPIEELGLSRSDVSEIMSISQHSITVKNDAGALRVLY